MVLPFWDDFSNPANTDTLWDARQTVWTTSTLGIKPPTFYVATFDGLNENGEPYTTINPTEFGFTDSLISRKINLAAVPLALRNSVFLSFFYQWGGFGEAPDATDYLRVEARNSTGNWITLATLVADPDTQQPDAFYDTLIRINDPQFYYSEFQFRFRSYGRRSGRYDTWHVDYVYLNANRTSSDNATPDRALSSSISAMLGRYYRMPLTHFFDNPVVQVSDFRTQNLQNSVAVLNYNSSITSTKKYGVSSNVHSAALDVATPLTGIGGSGSLQPFEAQDNTIATLPNVNDPLLFDPAADAIELRYEFILNSGDSPDSADYIAAIHAPLDFSSNDTVVVSYFLDSLYAYDDGTPEYSVWLTEAGNQAAYRFVLQANTADTLNGGFIHYPYTASTSPNILTLQVWANDNGKPGALLTEQTIAVRREGTPLFTAFDLNPAVLVKDTVFIGWEQDEGDKARIGLDNSNDTGDQVYVNTNGTWVQNDIVSGSLMIRPRFGPGNIVTGIPERASSAVRVYPNPSRGEFFITVPAEEVYLYSLTGQRIALTSQAEDDRTRIATEAAPGIYVLKYRFETHVGVQKILITQ